MDKEDEGIGIIEGLFKSKELYRILFKNAGEAIVFISETRIIDCNIAALALFGFRFKSDLTELSLFDLSPEMQEDGTRSKEKIQELIASANPDSAVKFGWTPKWSG